MTNKFENDSEKRAVWETILGINRLWSRENRPEALADFFHEKMLAVCGGESVIRPDGHACLAGWSWFCRQATDIRFEESDPHIALFCNGTVAVVAYFFECTYKMNGKVTVMNGRDLFTLVKENDHWRVAGDHFSPLPKV